MKPLMTKNFLPFILATILLGMIGCSSDEQSVANDLSESTDTNNPLESTMESAKGSMNEMKETVVEGVNKTAEETQEAAMNKVEDTQEAATEKVQETVDEANETANEKVNDAMNSLTDKLEQ